MTRKILQAVCIALISAPTFIYGQTFNYALSKSTGNYQSLSGTTLASGSNWSGNGYKIPVGFSCTMAGRSFDTVTVTSNGFILFGNKNNRAIAAFKGIKPNGGGNSSISYQSQNGVLKIEYKNVGFGYSQNDDFSFQVSINGQGQVEFTTGPTSLSSEQDSSIMSMVGVINPSKSGSNNGFVIEGDPIQPTGSAITGTEWKYLIRVPQANTVYTLTPQ